MTDTPLTPRALAEQFVTVREDRGLYTLDLCVPGRKPFSRWQSNSPDNIDHFYAQFVDHLAAVIDHALRLAAEGGLRREGTC